MSMLDKRLCRETVIVFPGLVNLRYSHVALGKFDADPIVYSPVCNSIPNGVSSQH